MLCSYLPGNPLDKQTLKDCGDLIKPIPNTLKAGPHRHLTELTRAVAGQEISSYRCDR